MRVSASWKILLGVVVWWAFCLPAVGGNSVALAVQRPKDKQIPTTGNVVSNPTPRKVPKSAKTKRPSGAKRRPEIYRLRVTVLDPQERPVEDAKITSTYGGEKMRVEGGLVFQIPSASIPKDGRLKLYASKESAYLYGSTDLQLTDDPNPAVTIKMIKNTEGVKVRGKVVDESNKTIAGARVNVAGLEFQAVTTNGNGGFVLPANAALGEQVLIHVEKQGYITAEQYHPAGDEPVTIILSKEAERTTTTPPIQKPVQRFLIRLDKIIVEDNGEGDTAEWTFDISINGTFIFNEPRQPYTIKKGDKPKTYEADPRSKSIVPISGDLFKIEVEGTRHKEKGNEKVEGTRPVMLMNGMPGDNPVRVSLRPPKDSVGPKRGRFYLEFSITKVE